MTAKPSLLKGKTVAVLGFNARPIACSSKNAGARVIVSDYWGDEDLDACSSKWTSILTPSPGKRQRAPLEKRVHVGLVENLLESIENEDVDFSNRLRKYGKIKFVTGFYIKTSSRRLRLGITEPIRYYMGMEIKRIFSHKSNRFRYRIVR